jgi:type VII secretion protein EccE
MALAGVGVLAVTVIRVRGRWFDQWVFAYLRYRERSKRWRGRRPASPLGAVVPGADTRAYADRAGNRVGLLTDGGGWTAVLQLDQIPDAELVPRLEGLLVEVAAAMEGGDIRIGAAQVVGWSVPTPSGASGGTSSGSGAPAWRVYWVAVRFVPDLHPGAVAARGGGEQGAIKSAAVAALRLSMVLRQRGYALRVLDGTELTAELSTSLGVEPPKRGLKGQPVSASSAPRLAVSETWRSWSLGALHHASFRLRRIPRQHAGLATVLTWLARPPAITTCVSVTFACDAAGPARTEVVVRFAVPADKGRRAVRTALRRAAKGFGAYLTPMNGEHSAGVRATIPLADAIREGWS